ncbi:DEAD/DEAH box helicase [Candidatus Uabimicrobium amorphum]|uniref:Helicase ATP-binding domain-containing protein n=1 Tax=Uabimicrobium amorphum TaxID=2596890 RepID=A0A5S9F729_UABAM|nr:DEAD/DEAH box helicase [Candidatus Uabimicrobium amorphum]BBM86832.1 hypothetical protein UABAM_05225 [Candidatus Uabimicrobium amorphum]
MSFIEKELALAVQKNTKPTYRAAMMDGKPIHDVANKGLKKGQVAIRMRNGEFHGLAVEALEDVKPLLNDVNVAKAILFLAENDTNSAMSVLNLQKEVQQSQNIGIMYEALKIWLQKNDFPVPPEYAKQAREIKCEKLRKWVLQSRHQPMDVPLRIKSIGKAKAGHSVVPEEWLERVFENAEHLHKEMDNLDSRKGKAPVTFCCSHSMRIREDYKWQMANDFLRKFIPQFAVEIEYNNNKLHTQVRDFATLDEYLSWIDTPRKGKYLPKTTHSGNKIVIFCDTENICRSSPEYSRSENVGLLVSMLQKAIRRGRGAASLLEEVIHKLASSPSYSLPEYQFARVSGSRQLVWRLFITILEDVEPYEPQGNSLGLLELASLSLLTHFDPDVQLTPSIIQQILYTALRIQHEDTLGQNWSWGDGKEKNVDLKNKTFGESRIENSLLLALKTMPMMEGDRKLLCKSIDYLHKWQTRSLNNKTIEELQAANCSTVREQTIMAAYDMHCLPGIILQWQANLPFVPYDVKKHGTKRAVNFIWDYSSSYNVRNKTNVSVDDEQQQMLTTLHQTQQYLRCSPQYNFCFRPSQSHEHTGRIPSARESRIAFQMIFGQKVTLPTIGKAKSVEIVVAGKPKQPCRVKRKNSYISGQERFVAEHRYIEHMSVAREIAVPPAPSGFQWIWGTKNKIKVRVELQHSDEEKHENEILFFAEEIPMKAFDAGPVLVALKKVQSEPLTNDFMEIVQQSLYAKKSDFDINYRLRALHRARKKAQDFAVYDWQSIALDSPLPGIIWRNVLVKMNNNFNSEVLIGPVDRNGKRLHDAISYLYEGTLLRMFRFLSFLYPQCVAPQGEYKFKIDKNTSAYLHLRQCLYHLAFGRQQTRDDSIKPVVPKITTILWDHQQSASDEIFYGLVHAGKKGYGDASNVGAGKTLTALTVLAKILHHNIDHKQNVYRGFLVLLPTEKLYKTWQDEIAKHTTGFDIVLQNADGSLSHDIQINSIVITTLGRMRNHPVYNLWQLVVIDECLSVQNKNALQTEEAWRQVISSQYGVMMMSATFFRSRFDKLFYMLKMLRSGLPEQKAYLDTILSEAIICHIPKEAKKWITTVHRFPLSAKMRQEYEDLALQNMSAQQVYIALSNYLFQHFDYVECFAAVIAQLQQQDRALIYARSKDEAEQIAQRITGVSRYPDKSGKHTVVSYAEGTYGLNDLIAYNTIVTRPPEPDKLPQMKGRLDRPGQQAAILNIKYILVENTIDEAWLFRLEMANNFYKNHILPLATFYEIAIGRRKSSQAFTSAN